MDAHWISFGEVEIEGRRYDHDVVIEAGRVSRRKKKGSKALRAQYGHTPLSTAEKIPWGGGRLIVGTGEHGSLPIAPDVMDEAKLRSVEIVALPTPEALRLLGGLEARDVRAVVHVTC